VTTNNNTFPQFSPEGQMAIFWRILHLTTVTWGNFPAGQLLVALTMTALHNRGMNPTLGDLCNATGLPKATVSRYVSWQLRHGMATEEIDPNDRRRRVLMRTELGQRSWDWQVEKLEGIFTDVIEQGKRARRQDRTFDSSELMAIMKRLTEQSKQLERP
jgi:DNA-binding MarR family transcriptional regulator